MKKIDSSGPAANSLNCDLDVLLHPARAFAQPGEVLADRNLTLDEKRAILASLASDACAVEAAPALRCAPGCARPVSVDAILKALSELDKASAEKTGAIWLRRQSQQRSAHRIRSLRRRSEGDSGSTLSH